MYVPQNRSSAEQALNHPFVTRAYKQDIGSRTCIPDPNYISPKGEVIPSMMIAPVPVDLLGNDTAYLTSVNLTGVNEGCVLRNLTPDDLGTTFDDIDTEELQKGGLITRIDPGTSRAMKKTANKMKNNHIIDREKIEKIDKIDNIERIENVQRVKNTYVQEDILAADNNNTTVSLPRSAWIDADAGLQTNLLKRDDSNLPHLSTSVSTSKTTSTTGHVHDQVEVQVAVPATSTSTAPVCGASHIIQPDALTLHHNHQNIPQNIPQVEEHSVTNVNVKTRESKRKLTAMQQAVAINDTTTVPQKRNMKRRSVDEKEKEREREGEGGRGGGNKELKEVVTATHLIPEKGMQGKAKMRLGDNTSSSSSSSVTSFSAAAATAAAAAVTSQLEVTKRTTNSIPNKRGVSSRYVEVSGEKGVGEKEKGVGERGRGAGGGRGEKGGSRDNITETESEKKTENKTESKAENRADMKTELDVRRSVSSSVTETVGGAGAGGGDNRRYSKRERSDTKHLQQQQQQQHQMIVCGGDTESSFLSQEDSNTTVETASQSSCDWYVPYRTLPLPLSLPHIHSFSLSFSHTHSLSPSIIHTHTRAPTYSQTPSYSYILTYTLSSSLLLSFFLLFLLLLLHLSSPLSLLFLLLISSHSHFSTAPFYFFRSSAKESQIAEPLTINFFE